VRSCFTLRRKTRAAHAAFLVLAHPYRWHHIKTATAEILVCFVYYQ
jgi:hypothetical protein